jgi:hypothetical protein
MIQGMEQVLQNINRLNRNLESVIAVSTRTDCTSLGRISPADSFITRLGMNSGLWKLYGLNLRTLWDGRKRRVKRAAMAMGIAMGSGK